MGLAISKRIIQKMGGNIEVESHVGQGSRFHFVLTLTCCENTIDQAEEIPATARGDVKTEKSIIPLQKELQALLHLSKTGRFRRMLQRLEWLLEKDKGYSDFIHPIFDLAKQFKANEIEDLLNHYLSHPTESS